MNKKYIITIVEITGDGESPSELYSQTTTTLDLRAVISAVNKEPSSPPRGAELRKRAPRSDKGKPRAVKAQAEYIKETSK